MSGHTPGPWKVAGPDLPRCVVTAAKPTENLFLWHEDYGVVICASDADAALIAQSPALLEQAEEVVDDLDTVLRLAAAGKSIDAFVHAMQSRARAAIARARPARSPGAAIEPTK